MTTLREQAVEAAMVSAHCDDVDAARGAEITANLYEPLLRDLVDEIMEEIISGHLPMSSTRLWDAITRAKEALS